MFASCDTASENRSIRWPVRLCAPVAVFQIGFHFSGPIVAACTVESVHVGTNVSSFGRWTMDSSRMVDIVMSSVLPPSGELLDRITLFALVRSGNTVLFGYVMLYIGLPLESQL